MILLVVLVRCLCLVEKQGDGRPCTGWCADSSSEPPLTPDVGQLEKLFDLVERSQRGYRDLIDTFDDLLFSISLDGRILAANRSFADLVGHPFRIWSAARSMNSLSLMDGGRAAAEKALPRFLERRHWSGVLRVHLKRDASTRFLQCNLHALVREGRDQGICVLAHDITQERENEARFTELFETLQEGVYLATADGHFENVNPAFARMLGYERREDMLDHPLSDFLLKPEQWEAEQRKLALSGSIHGQEVTLRRRDGSTVICLHAAALIRDTAGRVRRHQGTLVDITERRAMEQQSAPRAGICAPPGRKLPRSGRGAGSRKPLHVRESAIQRAARASPLKR